MRKHSCFVWPTGVHRFIDPSHVKCVFSWPQSWCKVGSRQTGTKGGDPSLHSYLQHATVSLNSLTLCFFSYSHVSCLMFLSFLTLKLIFSLVATSLTPHTLVACSSHVSATVSFLEFLRTITTSLTTQYTFYMTYNLLLMFYIKTSSKISKKKNEFTSFVDTNSQKHGNDDHVDTRLQRAVSGTTELELPEPLPGRKHRKKNIDFSRKKNIDVIYIYIIYIS